MTENNNLCGPKVFNTEQEDPTTGKIVVLRAFEGKQKELLHAGGIAVVLTTDDIITLKLLKDSYAREAVTFKHRSHRPYEITLETLERILGQIH